MNNPNCDGGACLSEAGEVRVLPLSKEPSNGNLILCRACYENEMRFRKERNRELGKDYQFSLPAWDSLEVYGEAKP